MTAPENQAPDRRRTLAVAEDAQRITHLAQELQRNAVELEGQSHKLRGTIAALEAANEELDRQTSEIAAAQATADAATARLARLQSITADSIAKAFGVGISEHPEAVARMSRHYGDPALFTPARRRMARVPDGATLVDNPISVAPGFQMENVFTFAGIPLIVESMFQSMKHRLVGGDPVLSRTVRTNLPEGVIAEPLGALQKRFEDLDIGSYPGFRAGKVSVSLVLRGTDDARLVAATNELIDTIHKMKGEAEELAQ